MLTEALITDVEIPQVDSQIVSRDVGLAIRIDRDGVDVVRMCIRVDFSRDGGDDVILADDGR